MSLLVQRDRFFILRDRPGVVTQRFQRESEGVQRLDVRRIDPKGPSNAFRAGSQLSWIENSLPRL